jgi:hypothetical protein
MGMHQLDDGSIIYEFVKLDHDPKQLINKEYHNYKPNYNKNLEISSRTKQQDPNNTHDTMISDYDVDDEVSPVPVEKKLSDRRLRKQERKKRLQLQKRITSIEDQFADIFTEQQIDEKSFEERQQEETQKEVEKEQLREHYRKNRKQLLQPWEILEKLEMELDRYIPGLSGRAKLIVANKIDLPGAAKNLEVLKSKTKLPIFPVSAVNQTNLAPVLHYLKKLLLEENK